MANSRMKLRQEARRQRDEELKSILSRNAQTPALQRDYAHLVSELVAGREAFIHRDPARWKPQLKSRDRGRIALGAVRYIFGRYLVPAHLEQIWVDALGLDRETIERRCGYYLTVASGGSLYKSWTSGFLSRKETHAFLTPLNDMAFLEALWCAVASSYTSDRGLMHRIARSRIARSELFDEPFWREAARFFCEHPTPLNEINDLCDYFDARLRADRGYSLKGRTPRSVRAQMAAWHRDLAQQRRIDEAALRVARLQNRAASVPDVWPGFALADWTYEPLGKGHLFRGKRVWIQQLKSGKDLTDEGNAQRHCVYAYKFACASGNRSIWSMRLMEGKVMKRLLTIEMNPQRVLVQIRGFANRMPDAEEVSVLRLWAAERGLGRV